MEYIKKEDSIIILNPTDFDVKQTLECGQIFRFTVTGNNAFVCSGNKMAKLKTVDNSIEIISNDIDFFEDFFDLKTDYSLIKSKLVKDEFLMPAIEYGKGVRILKNDAYEMIISFIISANNNIKRIKKSIEILCERFGDNMGDYYAFPTLCQLKCATEQDFINAGLGYRAKYMFETVQFLTVDMIEELKIKSKDEQFEFLLSLKGVGEKVANCILLFGLGRKDVFPVDTWINKVYNSLTNKEENNRKKITRELTARYGELSGYAQQYFFYYYRDNNIKT